MNNNSDNELEQLIHRKLRQLPDLRAPGDLIARVRRAIVSQTALPWWSQSWFAWPRLAQGVSAIAAFALIAGIGYVIGSGRLASGSVNSVFTEATAALNTFAGAFMTVLNAISGSLGLVPSTFLTIVGVLLALMYLGCIALGTLFYRVAVNPR